MKARRSGLALLLVVGVLGVLAVLAAAFVTMAQLERRASQQRLAATKALLLARSGIEDALARLAEGQDPSTPGNDYRGRDWDADGALSPFEAQQGPPGAGLAACPASQALHPSYHLRASAADLRPALLPVDACQRGSSGALGDGQSYALKVLPQEGFDLNGGDPAVPVDTAVSDYNLVLRRVLGTLAEAVDREDGMNDGLPADQADGLNLIDRRPSTGWKGWNQVRDLALDGVQARLDALRPYLTLHACADRKVIRPNAAAGMSGTAYQTWADLKLAHETYPAAPGAAREPDFERIPVLPGGRIVGRAPVGLAWARTRRPALIALLAGLKGLYLDESTAGAIAVGDRIGTLRTAEIALDWTVPGDDCRTTAGWILASTSDLGTWASWDALCDAIPDALLTGTTSLRLAKRDVLKANFNPNSRLNKFNPNASLWRSVDKSDLLAYSTEFSLLPMAAAQEIESVGRVLGKDGRLLASREAGASLAPAGRVTLTTQKEFVCDDPGDLSVAGDERSPRQPGQAGGPFLSRSAGPANAKTWGHALGLATLGDQGASLQTFPEPCVDAGSGLSTRAADYDGSVQLATVETPTDAVYGVTASSHDMKLLARYTTGLDLDVADAGTRFNQTDAAQVTTPQLVNGLLDAARPSTLYPDGCYSEKGRAPSYFDRGNANGTQGLLSFWVKSNHLPPTDNTMSRGHPFFKWTNFSTGAASTDSLDQFFYLGDSGVGGNGSPGGGILCQFEVTHSSADGLREHRFKRGRHLTPHQWTLLTLHYDFLSPTQNDCGEIRVNAGIDPVDRGSADVYSTAGNDPLTATDLTLPDLFGDHRLMLGKGRPEIESSLTVYTGSGADATLDELAVYDVGGADPGGSLPADYAAILASPEVLASNRYRDGRYYKENDAGYFSPLLRLSGPCRIRALAWTPVVPAGLKTPADPGPEGDLLLELVNASGSGYLPDAMGNPVDVACTDPRSSPVGRTVDLPFRLHVVFRPNLADRDNTPLLDPLALDDVTVLYEPAAGRRMLAWEKP